MDPAILDYLLFSTVGLLATTVGFATAWLRTRERAIRAEARLAAPSTVDTRFDSLDQTLEAMTLELERVAEAERFNSRLLVGRAESAAAPDHRVTAGRVITPH